MKKLFQMIESECAILTRRRASGSAACGRARCETIGGRWTWIPVAVIVSGCAAPASVAAPFRAPLSNPDKATVVLVEAGGLSSWHVVVDDNQFIGGLTAGTWFDTLVAPGHHEFDALLLGGDPPRKGACWGFTADLEAGRTYYVRLRFLTDMQECDQSNAQCAFATSMSNLANEDKPDHVDPKELGWTFRALKRREDVRMDPMAYLSARERREPLLAQGQAEVDAFMENGKYHCTSHIQPYSVEPGDYMK